MPSSRRWTDLASGETGSASLEFITAGLLLLVFVLALVTADSVLRRRVLPDRGPVVTVGAGLGAVLPLLAAAHEVQIGATIR